MAESERHHMRACFGPSDQLVLVLPNKPSNGQPATVEIHDAQRLEEQNEFECRSLFAGPLVRLDAPNYKLFYQCKKWMTGTQNIVEEDRDSFELIGNFLEHHIKQNGVMVRKNLIDLILKGHETTTTIQPNSDEEESDDRVNKIFAQGLEEIDQPFRVDRSIMSLKEVADHFRHLLMYGWKKDALDWAVKSKLWGHAFLLAHFMGRQAQAYVIGRFDSSDFEENDASQRFYEILNASPPATDPKTFGKKDGSPPITAAHPNVQDYMTQGGSLPNSGTASPVHIPQMPGSVPVSPDHIRHRFDGRLGPNDPSTSRMLPRQPGPDLTQGHLYQPSSTSGEGQSAREMGLGPTALDSSLYGPESLYQQQLDQGQMGYIQGQGVKSGGPDTAQAPTPQSDYVPLDQRWKKDKPVTPQSAYPQTGQRPVVSGSLKPQTSQGISLNTHLQPNQTPDQQNFYAQNLALANQELQYGQPGTFQGQGQNIPNQSMPAGQSQMQTSQYGQNMADFQTQRFSQPPQLPVHSAPASQVISQMPSSLPPQSMPVTREVTSTVSAVGGPVLSPGNENQDYRSMPQGNFGPQGQGQGQINTQQVQGQQHMSQPGYSEGQQVLQQFPQSQPQQHQLQPPGSQSFQGQGQVQVSGSQAQFQHSTFQPSGSQHQRYDQQHVRVPQQTGQQQHMGQGQTAQPAPQQHLKGQGQMTQYVSQQPGQGQALQQIPQHMGQYSQAQPQYSQAQPQYSQAQPQYSQAQPQYSQAQPQYSQAQPQSSQAQPQSSHVQPQYSQAQPQYSQAQPQYSQARPQYSQARPQYSQARPQYSQVRPQYSQARPQYSQAQPQSSQAQPQSSQAQPQYSQAQPQSSQAQPQYSQAQPQYSQPPANAQYNQGVQPAGQVNLQPTNQGQFDQRGTVQGQTSQFIPSQQLPGQQQLIYQPSVQGQTGHQKPFVHQAGQQIQNLPQTQQQTYTPAQQQNVPLQPSKFHAQQQFHQPPQSAPVQIAYSGASIQTGPPAPAQQQGVSTAGGQQNLHQFHPLQQQNFFQTQFSSSASTGTAGGYMQSGPRFAAPTSLMPQQQGVPAAPVSGQVAPIQQPVAGQGQQYQQPMITQGQNFVQPPHSSPAHPVYGAGALQSAQRLSAPPSASSQQNVQGQQYTGQQMGGIPQSQQGRMQPPLSGQGHQGQSAKTYSPAPAASVSQPLNIPTIPPVSGQGQFVRGHGTQQNVQGQYIGPQSQTSMGQGQFIPGQGIGQQPQKPQVPGYSETVVNRQFTQGRIPHGQSSQELSGQSQRKGQIPPSQGSQVYSHSQLPSSQSQQTYPQSQVGQFNHYQGQVPVNQQRPGVPNQTVAQQQYGHQGQMQGQSQYGQGTSQLNQTGPLPPMQQIPQQGQMSNKQSVLQPEVLKPTLPSGLSQGQTSSPQNQQNLYSSQGQGQNIQPPLQQQPVQPQGQPVTPSYQPVSPMHGNYQQGQQRPPSPAVPIVTQQGHIKTQDVKPTLSVEVKPSQPQSPTSHQSAARNISVDRQLSTASSLDEILSSSPDARTESAERVLAPKDALDWAIQNNLWGHAFSLASKMDNKTEDHVMRRFANMKVAVDDTLHTFCQIMSRSDVSEMEQDRLITWRPHLAMILSNQAENSDRDITFIRTMADALEFDGKGHASNFCYIMTEMCYGSSDNYKICLSASRISIVLKLIDSVKNVVHIYSLVLDCQEGIPTRHQELVTEVQTDQRNRHSSRLISGEDDLRELYEQQKSFILNKGIDSPELIQTCNGICKQILKENWNILDVKAYYIDNGSNSYKIMYGIICKDDSGSFNIQVKHVQWFLNSFEETKTVKFVPYSKVKMFSYRNRQHKSTIIHCIKNHCSELFKKHLNLKHISPSPFKEIKGEFTNEACIVMHILKKGLIPVGQSYLPRELEYLESECFPVDVRSTKYNFVYKADDFFQNLRMGCQVYSPIANGCFTLGGFVIGPNKNIFFVACAHSLLMEETVEEMVKHGKSVHEEDIESPEVCFQPEYKSKFRCGKLTKAVFKIGTDSEPGVDCALIQCFSERQPVCGYFPDSPGLFNILDLNSINNKKQYHASPCKKENIFTSGESLAQNQIPENSAVYKFGIRTGWTEGTLVSTFDSELNFSDFTFGVCMHGQFKVLGKDNWPFALEGDSGAWVFIRDRDGSFKAIGMVIGFEGNVTTVTPISAILDSLGLNKESIMSLPGSEDTDNFEDDDPSIKLHYEDEIKKVIPEPDIGFGITGFNMH